MMQFRFIQNFAPKPDWENYSIGQENSAAAADQMSTAYRNWEYRCQSKVLLGAQILLAKFI